MFAEKFRGFFKPAWIVACATAACAATGEEIPVSLVWKGRFVLDASQPFPDGVTFVPAAEYRAEIASLPAELRVEDANGSALARFAAPDDVAPPYTMHLCVAGANRPAVFATKDGATRFVRLDKWPEGFDPRRKEFLRSLSVRPGGGAGVVSGALSAGVGQADVRFVGDGAEGGLYRDGEGRLYFTFSERFFASACGVGSLDPSRPEGGVRFEGTILFDYGDGLLRNDLAPHLFFDRESGEWRGWACNFSTAGADTAGGRAEGGINAVRSKKCPLRGLSVMSAKPLGLSGMNEDPCGYFDRAAGKWRLLVSNFTQKGIRAGLLESDRWDGGFSLVAGPVAEDSTGTTIALVGGSPACLSGSADRKYYIYSYPKLEMRGAIEMDPAPWGGNKGWPHGRGWPALAELPSGSAYRRILLTMDRENYPGIPTPNWTYGALSVYVERSAE